VDSGGTLPAGEETGAVFTGDAEVVVDSVVLLGADERAHVGGHVHGVSDAHSRGERSQAFKELWRDGLLNEPPRSGDAHLTGVVEDPPHGASKGGLEVSVVEDDVRGLAPHLQHDLLERVGCGVGDLPSGWDAAGEGDAVDTRV
jgi:hypothetical protein